MPKKIVMYDSKKYDEEYFRRANKAFGFDIKFLQNRLTEDTAPLAKDADAVCAFVNDIIDKSVIDQLARDGIKLIAMRCAGYNNVDLKAIYNRIHIVRVPAYSPRAVAEHAIALMMSLNRKIHRAYYRVRDNNFAIHGFIGFDMYGKNAGVIGTGKIGKAAIEILKGFGIRVLAFDPYPDMEFARKTEIAYVGLDELYSLAHIITLHCPLSPDNVHMINEQSINQMKDGVMIINTGRGKLINTKDLINGLKNRKIGSAGLDVYEEETEYFFEDYSSSAINDDVLARLMTFPNVLITSHQGFLTDEALNSIANTTLTNIKSYFAEGKLLNEICYKCCENSCVRETTGKCF